MENVNGILEDIILGKADQARKELVEEMNDIVREWRQKTEKDIEAKVLIFQQAIIQLQSLTKVEHTAIKNEIIEEVVSVKKNMIEVGKRQEQLEIKLDKIIELINENERGTLIEKASRNLQQANLLMWIQGTVFLVLIGIVLVLSRNIL